MAWNGSRLVPAAIAVLAIGLWCAPGWALQESNVLVLYNAADADSTEIANYYQSKRPGVTLLGLTGVLNQEQVTAEHYLDVIRPQVLGALNDEVDAIVTTKGLPLRIEVTQNNPGAYNGWRGDDPPLNIPIMDNQWFRYSSLESELMRVDRIDSVAMMGDQAHVYGPDFFPPGFPPLWSSEHHARNPYYNEQELIGVFREQENADDRIRLSTRLDGFSVSDVKGMIDRAQWSQSMLDLTSQTFVVDGDPKGLGGAITTRLQAARDLLNGKGFPHEWNGTTAAITSAPGDVVAYTSLGTNDSGQLLSGYVQNQLGFNLADGAVFHTYESYNARSFDPGFTQSQALLAEWIEAGGTAAMGHVWEGGDGPENVTNEDIFLERMLQGYTFAEAFAAATFQLSYINTAIGDPLLRWSPVMQGDANLDGVVDVLDLDALGQSYGGPGVWAEGDFNGDNMIDLLDLNAISANFVFVVSGPAAPEPTAFALAMLALGGLMLLRRDHRPAKA